MATTVAQPINQTVKPVIQITGGIPLKGTVPVSGSKNAALPGLAATLLTREECFLRNVPDLSDIETMVKLLRSLGAEVDHDRRKATVRVRAEKVTNVNAPPDLVNEMRASFLVAGPLLARENEMSASTPGGCKLGARPVDVDVRGFRQMGAEVEFTETKVAAQTPGLVGATIYMDYPSHTGTENLLMAATLANGTTTIINASCEPEIIWLGNMLNRMGARIQGLGSPILTVVGVDRLHGVAEPVLPDRLEAGTLAIAGAITGGEVVLEHVDEHGFLPLRAKLKEAGVGVWSDDDEIAIRPGRILRALEVQTLPYPGFPTDLQAPFAVLLTQAVGESRIKERIFEGRLKYTDQLLKMGANIRVEKYGDDKWGTEARIFGPTSLRGATIEALDIRAGAGMVLAGLIAEGRTTVTNIRHIQRGYENLVGKLQSLGAQVQETVI